MKENGTVKRVFDTTRPNTAKPIYASGGDYNIRKIRAIICTDGDPIDVPSTASVAINARRPDGESKSFPGTANGDGSVTVPVAQWMLEVEGDVRCSISYTTADGKLSTTGFYITAQSSPHYGDVSEDDPEYDLLQMVLANENERVANEAERVAAENERVSAEESRKEAEVGRRDAEQARIANETERVSAEGTRSEKFDSWETAIGSLPSFDSRITRNAKEIANIKAGIPDEDFLVDSTAAAVKNVPENALPYAEVVEIGGLTQRVNIGTEEAPEFVLRSAPVTEVESVGVNLCNWGDVDFIGRKRIVFPYPFPAGTYTFGAVVKTNDTDSETTSAVFLDKDGGAIAYANGFIRGKYSSVPVNLSKDAYSVRLYASNSDANSEDDAVTWSNVMLTKGTTAQPYRPYVRNTLPIPAEVQDKDGYGIGLPSVPNSIRWEEDRRRTWNKRCGVVDLGTLDWVKSSSGAGGSNLYVKTLDDIKIPLTSGERRTGFLCAKYKPAENITLATIENKAIMRYSESRIYIRDDDYTDATTFKAAMSGVMLVYELAEPIVEDISDILPADNLLPVEGGGTVRMVSEYGYDVPSEIVYQIDNSNESEVSA